MAMREVRWERMFPDQIEAAFRQKPLMANEFRLRAQFPGDLGERNKNGSGARIRTADTWIMIPLL